MRNVLCINVPFSTQPCQSSFYFIFQPLSLSQAKLLILAMAFKTKVRSQEGFDWSLEKAVVEKSGCREHGARKRRRRGPSQNDEVGTEGSRILAFPLTLLLFGTALLVSFHGGFLLQPSLHYARALAEVGTPDFPSAWRQVGPSYQRMCQAILAVTSPEGHADENGSFYENMSLCLETDDLSNSLANIFASTFISHVAYVNGIDVKYEHKCHMRQMENDDKSRQSVQQLLPPSIKITDAWKVGTVMDKEGLVKLCQHVVDMPLEEAKSFAGVWTIMDYGLSPQKKPKLLDTEKYTVLEYMLPTIRDSLAKAVMAWSSSGGGSQRFIASAAGGYFIETIKNTGSPVSEALSRAQDPIHFKSALYLPCVDVNCTDAVVLPYYEYYIHIPRNVKTIDILVPIKCLQNVGKCKDTVNLLAKYLVELNPRAKVTLLRHGDDGSMDHFRRLYEADYSLCAPGWGTNCLFPALARRPATDGRKIVVMEQNHDARRGVTTASVLDSMSSDFDTHVEVVVPKQKTVGHLDLGDAHVNFTLQNLPTGDTHCRKIRGQLGKWEKDAQVAKRSQYKENLRHMWGKADRKHRTLVSAGVVSVDAFREPTTYAWKDGKMLMASSGPSCGMEFISLDRLCVTMKEMKMGRIFFLGDSLSLTMSLSLHNLIGLKGTIPWGDARASFAQSVMCPLSPGEAEPYTFTLEVARNNLLLQMTEEEAKEYHSQPFHFATQWEPRFLQDQSRTLLIVNFGAHMKTLLEFQTTLDQFLNMIDTLESKRHYKDLIMWRTSVPGHWGCEEPHSRKPHVSYQEYAKKRDQYLEEAHMYGWHLFEPQNDYAIGAIEARSMTPGAKAHIEVIDVHPMTILRQDGHVMFDSNVETKVDCLHYSLPGPADWWNHLLYSNLIDIAADEKALKVTMAHVEDATPKTTSM